mmetsp:Transcript_37508/g.99830  ORF Transcript_37508/g.99830 Transcript_37508/m.99830 type:complete len:217 (+) Transcript_37508:222-872(+)
MGRSRRRRARATQDTAATRPRTPCCPATRAQPTTTRPRSVKGCAWHAPPTACHRLRRRNARALRAMVLTARPVWLAILDFTRAAWGTRSAWLARSTASRRQLLPGARATPDILGAGSFQPASNAPPARTGWAALLVARHAPSAASTQRRLVAVVQEPALATWCRARARLGTWEMVRCATAPRPKFQTFSRASPFASKLTRSSTSRCRIWRSSVLPT